MSVMAACVRVYPQTYASLPTADGVTVEVRDASEDLHEAVVALVSAVYLREEPLVAVARVLEDPVSVAEMQQYWRDTLCKGAGLVAVAQDRRGNRSVVGANVTGVKVGGDASTRSVPQCRGEARLHVWEAVDHVYSLPEADVFSRFGVSRCLVARALAVDPAFRGRGVGEALLRARWPLCESLGLALTVSLFTSRAAQRLARRVGFSTVLEVPFSELPPAHVYGGVTDPPCVSLMAAEIRSAFSTLQST